MAGENAKSPDPFGLADGYSASQPYTPSSADLELVGNLRRQFDHCRDHRAKFDKDWPLYLAYLSEDQLLYRDLDTNELVRVLNSDKRRLWSINNQLAPIAQSRVGKITRGEPSFRVAPGPNGEDVIQGARVAERLIEHFMEKERVLEKWQHAVEDESWAGFGMVQLTWDRDAGAKFAYCQTCSYKAEEELAYQPCPSCAEKAQMEAQQSMMMGGQPPPPSESPLMVPIAEGDAKVRHFDPRFFYPQPGVTKLEELQYYTLRYPMPVTVARKLFPDHAAHLHAEEEIYAEDGVRSTYSIDTGITQANALQEHLFIHEYYEQPSGMYPRGRLIYYANNIILSEGENPYYFFGRHNIFLFFGRRTPGRLIPIPFMAHAWHRQKELNELETHFREYAEIISRPKVLVPIGSRIASDEISAVSNQVIMHNAAAGEPKYMQPPEMPQSLYERRNTLQTDMRLQANVTQQEMSQAPTDPNGRVLAILEAESDQSIGPIVKQHMRELSDLVRCVLFLYKRFKSPDAKFALTGDGGFEVFSFQDLNLDTGASILIEVEDGLSKNQALRVNEAMSLAQVGVFGAPGTPEFDIAKFAKVARLKIPGLVPDTSSTEFAAAMAAIKQIEDGIGYQPAIEDDPQIFSTVILQWLRGQGRRVKMDDPGIYIGVQQLYMYYIEAIQMAMMGQQMDPNAAPGQPSPGGGDMSAPGGTANGTLPETSGGQVGANADAMVKQADASAESAVRSAQPHEG